MQVSLIKGHGGMSYSASPTHAGAEEAVRGGGGGSITSTRIQKSLSTG